MAATRELMEETDYKGKIQSVARCYGDAYSSMNRYCFVATDCEKAGKAKLEENEFAELVFLDLNEFRDLLRSGKMTDVEVGYLGLDYLKLF